MSKINGHANQSNPNIGDWLSAKIYSDVKSGCASCGGTEWRRVKLKGVEDQDFPVCAGCGEDPDRLVIVATVIDEVGRKKQVKVRNTQDGKRLSDRIDCVYTLRRVASELRDGTFHIGRYESAASREAFIFRLIIGKYLRHHSLRKARGELSPGGLRDKESLIRNHILPQFGEVDIALINEARIKAFYNGFTDRLRTRDKATQELKTILIWAKDEKKISELPDFPEISPSNMVTPDRFLSGMEQARVIAAIENPGYRNAIALLALYALRPCEVRSLKWSDIDFGKCVFYIRSHISNGVDIKGRKSQKNKVHSLPIMPDFQAMLDSLVRPLDSNTYLFQGSHGGAIGGNVLTKAWNDACKIAKIKGVTLYQGTKHSTLSRLAQDHTDTQMRALTGHASTLMLQRYAQSTVEDVRRLLGG